MSNLEELKSMFSDLLAAAADTLSSSELDEVRHFVDVNEMPLALETMVEICVEERKSPPLSVMALVQRIAIALKIEPNFLLRRLQGRGFLPEVDMDNRDGLSRIPLKVDDLSIRREIVFARPLGANRRMKSIEELPADIGEAVDRIYRKGDHNYVKSRRAPSDKWLPIVKSVAGAYVTREQTDLNYGLAHVYDIFLTQDARACVAQADAKKALLENINSLELVRLSVSVLVPYYMLTFGRYRLMDGDVRHEFALHALSDAQRAIEQALERAMAAAGIRRLGADLAEEVVPGVETELRAVGTATVSDLVIGPY